MYKINFILLTLALLCCSVTASFDWPNHGGNLLNTRYVADDSSLLTSDNVASLQNNWIFQTQSFVMATPSIRGSKVYFPANDGYLYSVSKNSGVLAWKKLISEGTGLAGDIAKVAPVLSGNTLIYGSQRSGQIVAVKSTDGTKLWSTLLDPHPASIITMSGTVYGNYYYVGTSSAEEYYAGFEGYPCCYFVGGMYRVHLQTGEVDWSFKTIAAGVPVGPGLYSGVAVWGSSPVIDVARNSVYFATGNPYQVPQSVSDCILADPESDSCIDEGVYFNSVIALDLDTGAYKWHRRLSDYDAFNIACFFAGPNCPSSPGEDYDFGMAPTLVQREAGDLLLISQKSGGSFALNPDTGAIVWGVQVGPGGAIGGAMWGAPTDGELYFVGNANSNHLPYSMIAPASTVHYGGGWSALNVSTGEIEWQVADPAALSTDFYSYFTSGGVAPGTLVNDLYIVGSSAPNGYLYIFNKYTGELLWSFATGGSVNGGASVSGNCIYIGSGASQFGNPYWTGNNKVFSFCIPDLA